MRGIEEEEKREKEKERRARDGRLDHGCRLLWFALPVLVLGAWCLVAGCLVAG